MSTDADNGEKSAKEKRKRHLRVADESGEPDGRPLVRITTQIETVMQQAIAALASEPDVYERDLELVHIVRAAEIEASRRANVPPDTPTIRRMHPATLRARLSRCAKWERYDAKSGEWVPAVPPDNVVIGIINEGQWPGIRSIAGIVEAPALRPDGSAFERAGYDPITGFLYFPNANF